MMSFENDPQKCEIWNTYTFSFFFFALAFERIFIKTHSFDTDVIGPENILFAGASVHLTAQIFWQCPLSAPSVRGPQMVWECVCVFCVFCGVCVCVCVCVCERERERERVCVCVDGMNLKYALRWHIHISVHSVLCQRYTQAYAHTHPQTIWG